MALVILFGFVAWTGLALLVGMLIGKSIDNADAWETGPPECLYLVPSPPD